MDFEFTAEQQALRDSVRAMLDKECPIGLVRALAEHGTPADHLWNRMVELDWPALTIPEETGGIGLSTVELAIVAEELGRALAPVPFLATVSQFAPAVREAGAPEQRKRFLAEVAAGRVTGALAVFDGNRRGPLPEVHAVARADGDGWVLDGTKRFVADGATADEVVVAARTGDRPDQIGLFVVPGADLEATPLTVADATQPLADLALRGVRVPADRALGTPGEVATALQRALEEATVAVAAATVGTCDRIVAMTLQYAKDRHQFGVPIGSFQAVKHKLVDLFVILERARALAYFAALTIAEEDPRRALAVSMAKAAAGECQRLVVQDGLQLHGGIGFTWEHDLHLYLKRAKAGDAQLGTAAAHRARVAALIGLGS